MADMYEPLTPQTGEGTRTDNSIFYNNRGGFAYIFLAEPTRWDLRSCRAPFCHLRLVSLFYT